RRCRGGWDWGWGQREERGVWTAFQAALDFDTRCAAFAVFWRAGRRAFLGGPRERTLLRGTWSCAAKNKKHVASGRWYF
ncbi:unnamed protein product, partial [Discosporangium mesarthrocarpum]